MSAQPQTSLFGISHKTAPMEILGRLALNEAERGHVYQRLLLDDRISDALVLSTCNRTEIYTVGGGGPGTTELARQALVEGVGPDRMPAAEHVYDDRGSAVVEHLFRVSCGLDSMILGEAQILGQIKGEYESAQSFTPPSPYFDRLMQAVFKVSKRSRAETQIGKGAVSIASAGVHLASRIFSDLSRLRVAVVGAGDTGRLAAEHFSRHRPQKLWIINRNQERAEAVARHVDGEGFGMQQLPIALAEADVVVVAVGVQEPLVTFAIAEPVIRRRAGRTLALVDLGVPRNIDPAVDKLLNTFVTDINDLRQVVDQNLEQRRREVPQVERMIAKQVESLLAWQNESRAAPLISSLRQSIEEFRQRELSKVSAKLSPGEREAVDRVTRGIVNKLLHGPMTSIKAFARQQEEGAEHLHVIRDMFSGLVDDGDTDRDDVDD